MVNDVFPFLFGLIILIGVGQGIVKVLVIGICGSLVVLVLGFGAGRLVLSGLGHGIFMNRGLGLITSLVGVLSDRSAD